MDVGCLFDFVIDVVEDVAATLRRLLNTGVVGMFGGRRLVDGVKKKRIFDKTLMSGGHDVGEFQTSTIIVRFLTLFKEPKDKNIDK